jgi:hypothetical protein
VRANFNHGRCIESAPTDVGGYATVGCRGGAGFVYRRIVDEASEESGDGTARGHRGGRQSIDHDARGQFDFGKVESRVPLGLVAVCGGLLGPGRAQTGHLAYLISRAFRD